MASTAIPLGVSATVVVFVADAGFNSSAARLVSRSPSTTPVLVVLVSTRCWAVNGLPSGKSRRPDPRTNG